MADDVKGAADLEATKDVKSKRRRVKSAVARLSTPPQEELEDAMVVQKEFKQRTDSAHAIRKQHTSSRKILPTVKGEPKKDRFKSMYTADFRGKYVTPPEARPTSPTRRHNPHPSRQFLNWKTPTRIIGTARTNSDFGDEGDLVGSFERMQLPMPEPSSKDYGQYLRVQRARQQQLQQEALERQQLGSRALSRPVSSEVLTRTVRRHSVGAFDEWLLDASPDEQDAVLRMLKTAEEHSIKDSIRKNLQPDAAKAVEGWLSSATEDERDVATRLFTTLDSKRDSRPPTTRHLKRTVSAPGMRPGSVLGSGLQGQAIPNLQPPYQSGGGAMWHLKSVREPPTKVYHGGALFGATRIPTSHYTIHPEWPDYTTTDPVAH